MICDLAEYYHIFDYQQLPPSKVAVLVFGLREGSRVKMKISGEKLPLETMLLSIIADNLAISNWLLSQRFSGKRTQKPESIFAKLTGSEEKKPVTIKHDVMAFETPEELEAYLRGE